MKTKNYLAIAVAILATITASGQQKKPAPTPKTKGTRTADGQTRFNTTCPKGWKVYIPQKDMDEYNNMKVRTPDDMVELLAKAVCVVTEKGDPK